MWNDRWRLYADLRDFQAETNRFFEDVIRRLQLFELAIHRWSTLALESNWSEPAALEFMPPTALPAGTTQAELPQLRRSGETLIAEILLPEVDPDEIVIRLKGHQLVIQGRFVHTIQLPEEIDPQHVEATFQGGRLRLTVREPVTILRRIPIRKADE